MGRSWGLELGLGEVVGDRVWISVGRVVARRVWWQGGKVLVRGPRKELG